MNSVSEHCAGVLIALLLSLFTLIAQAEPDDPLAVVIAQWDRVQFDVPDAEREAAFAELLEQLDQRLAAEPKAPRVLMWRGITKASLAGVKGGLSALSLVKSAKKDLDRAIKLGAGKTVAAAYTTLGSLYYQVPGWPIGFGSDELADKNLQAGLALTPQDIDAHYFYGNFLHEQGRDEEAARAYRKALACPPRPARPLADRARRNDIRERLNTLP